MSMYIVGFVLSLITTLSAFGVVIFSVDSHQPLLPHNLLLPTIVGLAVLQLVIQLVFFIHLGSERKPRFNLMAFLFMLLVIFILVIGSLWIMANLNYNMMPGQEAADYIVEDEGIHNH